MSRRQLINQGAQLDALYATLPHIECAGLCHDSCKQIDMSSAERTIIAAKGIHIPAVSVVDALRTGARPCPALTMLKRCAVYEIRPLICRIYGLASGLPCAHGCQPDRYLSDSEAREILAQAADISGQREQAAILRATPDQRLAQALAAIQRRGR